MITINNFQAGYGDTFLIEINQDGLESVNILIDCGFGFKKNVLPVLDKIRANGGTLNRMIITHYDDDHIRYAKQFLKDYTIAGKRVIFIEQIWLNTFRHLLFAKDTTTQPTQIDLIRTEAYITDYSSRISSFQEGDIGAAQATNLGAQVLAAEIPWNTDFDEKAVCIENKREVKVGENVRINLLSPNYELLGALKDKFITDLRIMGIAASEETFLDDAFELYSRWLENQSINQGNISADIQEISIAKLKELVGAYEYTADLAEGNGSSIAFVLHAEEKRLLFLADAHAEDVIIGLIREFPDCETRPVIFNVIKVAHHGSFRNNKPELHLLMDSAIYIFSTNGKHMSHVHPDVETIVQIIYRPLPLEIKRRKLYFNYKLKHLSFLDDPEYQQEFKFEVFYDLSFTI